MAKFCLLAQLTLVINNNYKHLSDIIGYVSNTLLINNTEKTAETKIVLPKNSVTPDKQILAKIKLLANYYKKDYTELVDEALKHYLCIKNRISTKL